MSNFSVEWATRPSRLMPLCTISCRASHAEVMLLLKSLAAEFGEPNQRFDELEKRFFAGQDVQIRPASIVATFKNVGHLLALRTQIQISIDYDLCDNTTIERLRCKIEDLTR